MTWLIFIFESLLNFFHISFNGPTRIFKNKLDLFFYPITLMRSTYSFYSRLRTEIRSGFFFFFFKLMRVSYPILIWNQIYKDGSGPI